MPEPSPEVAQTLAARTPVGPDRDAGYEPGCGDLFAAVPELALQERFEERGVDAGPEVIENELLCGDPVEGRSVELPGAQGQQAEAGLLDEREMGIAQDLGRRGERVDGPVDVVAGRALEPYQPVGYLKGVEQIEQAGVAREAMVVIFLDPVIADPV